jgi:hypothetical protein
MLPPFGSFFIFVLGFFERKKLFIFQGLEMKLFMRPQFNFFKTVAR